MINDQLVIFGGWDAPICYNDLHILDMSKIIIKNLDFKTQCSHFKNSNFTIYIYELLKFE